MVGLERNRGAFLGLVVALWLAYGAYLFIHLPLTVPSNPYGAINAPSLGPGVQLVHVFFALGPYLVLSLVGVNGFLGALSSRARGEALDRRPFQLATAAGALGVIVALLLLPRVSPDALPLALPLAAATIALFGFAFRDWATLFAILRSKQLVEYRDVERRALPIVDGMATPVMLYEPVASDYRHDAKGAPVAAVPERRELARGRIYRAIFWSIGLSVAAVGVAVPAVRNVRVFQVPVLDEPMIGPSVWRGEAGNGGDMHPFTLEIEAADHGKMTGAMDWGDVVANVEGTYDGHRLVFFDRSIRKSSGAPFNLNDRKDVEIAGDSMFGTDSSGRVPLHARRVR